MVGSRHEPVECKTVDQTILRGLFFAANGPAPIIIMSHGFNCVKEMTLPEIAESFQASGYNALIYDARSVGASEGFPRNLLNPLQMAEDLSDIVTFTTTLPTVDARRILLWGMSFGGMVSGICSTLDRRIRGVAMVCPLFSFVTDQKRKTVLAQCIKDRTSQLRGNEAYTLQPFNSRGENPAGMGGSGGPGGVEAYNLMQAAAELGHPGFRNRIALQTYLKLVLARPKEIIELLEDVPVFMVIPELDDISAPAEQQELFDKLNVKKRLYLAKGKGHLSIMTGDGSVELIESTKQFFSDALEGKLR
ncbi:hypothetical protein KCU99_g6870, partial [Aureobasidium melanogenum]